MPEDDPRDRNLVDPVAPLEGEDGGGARPRAGLDEPLPERDAGDARVEPAARPARRARGVPPTPEEILQRRIDADARRAGESVDVARLRLVNDGLQAREERRARARQNEARLALQVDVLLVTATLTEHRELQRAAAQFGLMVQERVGRLGLYYHFGQIGTNRVATMQVAMGAFGPQGSVSKCLQARAETRASTLMLVGTAFGIDPNGQRIGDVIVSDSVFMYDDRHARDGDELLGVAPLLDRIGRLVDHVSGDRWGLRGRARRFCGLGYVLEHPSARRPASAAWVDRFRALGANYHQLGEVERVTVGTILSGGALIESAHFRNELAALVPPTESPVLGGEMEALGALAAAKEDDDPGWIIVKSISDFADGATRAEEELGRNRETAARAAARAVLHALSSPANLPPETIDGEREQIS